MFAPKELVNGIYMQNIWKENNNLKYDIHDKVLRMLDSIKKMDLTKQEKYFRISQSEKVVLQLNRRFYEKELLHKTVNQGKMSKQYDNFVLAKINLNDRVESVNAEYESLLMGNEKNTKKIFEIKYKKEANLLNWIQKFDNDIGSKQNQFDGLTDHLANITSLYKEYQQMVSDQESAYNEVLELKRFEAIEGLILRTKNRSAKKIQVWFKKEMKKLKKKRKKAARRAKKMKGNK